LDDPINFFAAQGHTQRAGDLAMRKDEMSEAIQTIKAANNGLEAMTDMIASAKSLAQSAMATNDLSERGTLQGQYEDMLDQISDVIDDSGYKGTNLLDSVANQSIVVSFDESGDSSLTVSAEDVINEFEVIDEAATAVTAWDTADDTSHYRQHRVA
jgi:flagellin